MTVGFNFLEAPELPAPQVSEAQAEEILATHYGLRARVTSLGSNQDKNFVVTGLDGDIVGVLKIANPAFNATEIEAQIWRRTDRRGRRYAWRSFAEPLDQSATIPDYGRAAYVRLLRCGRDTAGLGPCRRPRWRGWAGGRAGEPGARGFPAIPASIGFCNGICASAPPLWRRRFIRRRPAPLRRRGGDGGVVPVAPLVDELPRRPFGSHRRQRRWRAGLRPRLPRRSHRLRRPVRQLGGVRTGDHGVVGTGPPR
jgi:hypothetical protein